VELAFDFLGTGYQDGGIAGTALDFANGNGMAGNAACGFDNFANAESATIAQVIN
jgi:hypothetical protein